MQANQVDQFNQILISAAEVVGKSISPESLVLYWDLLSTFELDDVVRAVKAHLQNAEVGAFMPKPADIIKHIEGTSDSRSMQAWSKVVKAIRFIGPHQSICFDDPIVHSVLDDMGGWVKFGTVTDDEMPFLGNEFDKRYRGYLIHPVEKYKNYLIGISEGQMGKDFEGHPVLFGDTDRAKYVFANGEDKSMISIERDYDAKNKKITQEGVLEHIDETTSFESKIETVV